MYMYKIKSRCLHNTYVDTCTNNKFFISVQSDWSAVVNKLSSCKSIRQCQHG